MDWRLPAPAALTALLLVTLVGSVSGQENSDPEMPDSFKEAMPLYAKGLGAFSRDVTTDSPEAQAFFNQGIQLMYAFTPENAARSFREAQLRDPNCAMCFWGEAWAWGPYMNGPMGPGSLPRAQAAMRKAVDLAADHANEVERDLIETMAIRYTGRTDRKPQIQVDTTYAEAMAQVYRDHPNDLDAGFLSGEGFMLLEPRRGSWNGDKPEVQRIHGILEHVLEQDITHPGVCHLYIHATESTTRPDKAEACADHLGNSIPGASHINHMPSHTYNRVGRWDESVRGNLQAFHSDQAAAYGEGFAIYPSHNLHMLLFAASMGGQGAVAIQAGRDYAAATGGAEYYEVLTKLRFGRFDEILEMDNDAENPIFHGLTDFAFGYAHLRQGRTAVARGYLDAVQTVAREEDEAAFRGHSAEALLGVVGGILEGEILREEDDLDAAIVALERSVELEDGLRYDEPEPLNFSARHWLGAALLEAERPTDAEAVYRAALDDHPHNGWSLFGLEQALRAQKRTAEADEALAAFETEWADADTWIRSSRF